MPAHQYELLKLPNTKFYWNTNNCRPDWSERIRPNTPENLSYVPYYEPGKYDMALLHIDQASMYPVRQLSKGKNMLSCDMNDIIKDIPKVIIEHGTPYWPETEDRESGRFSSEWLVAMTKKFVGKSSLIVNSHRAQEMWGMGRVITHGLDPKEWWDLPKEFRVLTTMSPDGWAAYYGRMLYSETRAILKEQAIKTVHIGTDYICGSFDDYRNFIGRSLIYFNPTKESPMPRSRTEAMLSGACIVTTVNHDEDMYFNCDARKLWMDVGEIMFPQMLDKLLTEGQDVINGILVPENPKACAMVIEWLWNHYKIACKIGKNGKAFAQRNFHIKDYQDKWSEVIREVTGKDIYA